MTQTFTIGIDGLSCASCVRHAEAAVGRVDGATAVVNLATATARVSIEDQDRLVQHHLADVATALDAAGYPVRTETISLHVDDMHCASCVGRIEAALHGLPGVVEAGANLAARRAEVRVLSGAVAASDLVSTLADIGFSATAGRAPDDRVDETATLRRATLQAAALALPVFVLEMGSHMIPGMHALIEATIGMRVSWVIQALLSTLILIGPGWTFYRIGVPALLRGAPDMNALVALGTAAAWSFSMVATLTPSLLPPSTQGVYFEAVAVITTLILAGRLMEARARGRAGAAIRSLLRLGPEEAEREEASGGTAPVAVSALAVGDVLRIKPGARVPTDGVVLDGASHVDESMLTGEPVPVLKTQGDPVVGGTINGVGALRMRATAVGAEATLARIVRMVEDAQGTKLPIQTLVDRVTTVFVPVVLVIALAAAVGWGLFGGAEAGTLALVTAISVLIIACPCAMGLATPTSVMVGSGRAAELGVLFRRGDALQRLADIRVLAFDKTGTLTEGRPSVVGLETLGLETVGLDENTALAAIAAVERRSEHPVAQAIVWRAEQAGLSIAEARNFRSRTGLGAAAEVEGHTVLVGSARYMAAEGVALGPLQERGRARAALGQTPVYAAIDGEAVALIGISDRIKAEATAIVSALKARGIDVAMISGDTQRTAEAVAREIGIETVIADVRPDGKVAALGDLRARHGNVAFVGDGINDAPVLAEADVGIAVGTGTDIAIETADVVLMSGALSGVLTALEVSNATLRNIRQNLFWAFAYNAALIPVAAGVLYPLTGTLLSPMLAAGAMGLSSVFVVSNALRLKRLKAPGLNDPRSHIRTASHSSTGMAAT